MQQEVDALACTMKIFSSRRRLSFAIKVVAGILLLTRACQAADTVTDDARPAERAMNPLGLSTEADGEPPCTTTTDAVVHAARQVCGSAPVAEALLHGRRRPA